MSDFARPIKDLAKAGVTVDPRGGQAVALTPAGKMPHGTVFASPDGLPRQIAVGTSQGTWPGGAVTSNTTTVAHGLGRVPIGVWVQVTTQTGVTLTPVVASTNYTSTGFDWVAQTVDAQLPLNTAKTNVVWLAVA